MQPTAQLLPRSPWKSERQPTPVPEGLDLPRAASGPLFMITGHQYTLPCSHLARPASTPPQDLSLEPSTPKLSLILCEADPMLALLTTTSLVGDIYLPAGWKCFPVGEPLAWCLPQIPSSWRLPEAQGLLGDPLGSGGWSEGS